MKTTPSIRSDSWTDFFYELEILLGEVVEHGGAWVNLTSVALEKPFVQLAATTDGRVVAEASNTLFHPRCGLRHLLEDLPRLQLTRLGWRPPARHDGHQPITTEHLVWTREADPRWPFPHLLLCELLVRTLVEVFAVPGPAGLVVETGSTPCSGGISRD